MRSNCRFVPFARCCASRCLPRRLLPSGRTAAVVPDAASEAPQCVFFFLSKSIFDAPFMRNALLQAIYLHSCFLNSIYHHKIGMQTVIIMKEFEIYNKLQLKSIFLKCILFWICNITKQGLLRVLFDSMKSSYKSLTRRKGWHKMALEPICFVIKHDARKSKFLLGRSFCGGFYALLRFATN